MFTSYGSAIKVREYLATGKPVVISPLYEYLRTPGVKIYRTVDEFIALVEEALAVRYAPRAPDCGRTRFATAPGTSAPEKSQASFAGYSTAKRPARPCSHASGGRKSEARSGEFKTG